MKCLLLILLLPLFSSGQTIHFDDDKILYKGKENVGAFSSAEIYKRLQLAMNIMAGKGKIQITLQPSQNGITATGETRLKTPFHIIRLLHYTIAITAVNNGYEYRIDSVYVTEQRRGREPKVITDKEMLEGREETGAAAIETEKLLNEIDMHLQKLIAVVRNNIQGKL